MPDIYTAAGVHLNYVEDWDGGVSADSDPRTCNYTHFNLTTEQLGRTWRYNCWGFTFLPRRYWINSDTDVDNIIHDNCDPIPDGSVRVGDVIRYRDDSNITTHTGRVWQTDGAGHATLIRSKWGPWAEYIHLPLDVPNSYGTNLAYFRQKAPLIGVADLWIKDSPTDNGEQFSGAPWWISPDILVDVPPYDGIPDANPVFDNPNRVWAVVRNRSNIQANNVYIRYYWADPAAGLSPADWHLILGTAGHPNPAGPINIPGNSSTEAPYVEWTPEAAPAHQCLLAIAYVNDDPKDSNNPDPLVYPFDIPWDNNIAQRNVHITELKNGTSSDFAINVGSPFREIKRLKGSINAMLTYSHKLPIIGLSEKKIFPLKIDLVLDKKQKFPLKAWKGYLKEKRQARIDNRFLYEKPIASMISPELLLTPGKPHRLNVKITVPSKVKVGSIYYLHIGQHISNAVTGGYTFVIVIV
jgi:hypothetical protein